MLLLYLVGPTAAHLVKCPLDQVEETLGSGEDVEGRGDRAALLKVGDPQLGAGKLPLNVGLLLMNERERLKM